MARTTAPAPADESVGVTTESSIAVDSQAIQAVIAEPAAEVAAPPAERYFIAVNGITDGAIAHGTDDHFVGSETLLAHYDRTGGMDGARVLYREIDEGEYRTLEAKRLAAIQNVEVIELPQSPTINQVMENAWASDPIPGPVPVGATPGGAGFTTAAVDRGMA